mmetsp:Transcript_14361/g.38754  ORF Transcript_14361/g.38754 Transcript_14361/m.38754 type:complete len:259 (-) Transcript_14361:290-1066(-)
MRPRCCLSCSAPTPCGACAPLTGTILSSPARAALPPPPVSPFGRSVSHRASMAQPWRQKSPWTWYPTAPPPSLCSASRTPSSQAGIAALTASHVGWQTSPSHTTSPSLPTLTLSLRAGPPTLVPLRKRALHGARPPCRRRQDQGTRRRAHLSPLPLRGGPNSFLSHKVSPLPKNALRLRCSRRSMAMPPTQSVTLGQRQQLGHAPAREEGAVKHPRYIPPSGSATPALLCVTATPRRARNCCDLCACMWATSKSSIEV